jgi:hypothetical protein
VRPKHVAVLIVYRGLLFDAHWFIYLFIYFFIYFFVEHTAGLRHLTVTQFEKPFKDEAQTALFKDPVRTAQ